MGLVNLLSTTLKANKKNRLTEPLEFPPIFEPIPVLWPERSIYHPGQFTRDDAKGE